MIRLLGVALVVAALGATTGASARLAVEPPIVAGDWGANATTLRTATGSRFVYVCPGNGRRDQVWGTRVYTDDSSVCTAAVHAGVITIADGGLVTIEHLPGQASYTGSTANGITSANWGAYAGSFQVIGADRGGGAPGVKMGGGGWTANATSFRGLNGSRFEYVCPGGGRIQTVYGTNVYTDDTSVCSAAVHVGLFDATNGGRATIEIRPGQSSYASSTHNGVTSRSYPAWLGSFVFAGAAQLAAPPGGGAPPATTTTSSGSNAPPTGTPTGTVLVNGRPFTGGTVPFNATVDVTNGTLRLTTSTGTLKVNGAGGITAAFVLKRGTDNKKPIVELRLTKGDFSVCKRKKSSAARVAATTVRQLWGEGKGSFRTKGRYASATIRGTKWLTADRCDGTLTRVTQGVVQVSDIPKRTLVTVRAGKSYLAKP